MEAKCNGRGMWDVGSLRHMPVAYPRENAAMNDMVCGRPEAKRLYRNRA